MGRHTIYDQADTLNLGNFLNEEYKALTTAAAEMFRHRSAAD
jgi:hypothetical protein